MWLAVRCLQKFNTALCFIYYFTQCLLFICSWCTHTHTHMHTRTRSIQLESSGSLGPLSYWTVNPANFGTSSAKPWCCYLFELYSFCSFRFDWSSTLQWLDWLVYQQMPKCQKMLISFVLYESKYLWVLNFQGMKKQVFDLNIRNHGDNS